MNSCYANQFLESKTTCQMNDTREIITDRMGSWNNQNVTLVWEGYYDGYNIVSLTPDEVEILFTHGLITNVVRGEDGKLYQNFTFLDSRSFSGAIVCGILAPTTANSMRPEIIEYAKKMKYISDTMTPIKMLSGTKSLIVNSDDTYSILFNWDDNVVKKIHREFLNRFTMNFFDNKNIDINIDGVLLKNLSESEVFSRKNIDIFRIYDIQLFYLNPEIDKTLLLRAVMQRAFIHLPCNTLHDEYFKKIGNIEIPEDRKEHITFNEFGKNSMDCGILYHSSEHDRESYTYNISVPYSEYIRELMIDTEKMLKAKYGNNVLVVLSLFNQYIHISIRESELSSEIERDIISLDYAIRFLQTENKLNSHQLYYSIISLLESDSSGYFRHVYFSYLKTLKDVLPEKWWLR